MKRPHVIPTEAELAAREAELKAKKAKAKEAKPAEKEKDGIDWNDCGKLPAAALSAAVRKWSGQLAASIDQLRAETEAFRDAREERDETKQEHEVETAILYWKLGRLLAAAKVAMKIGTFVSYYKQFGIDESRASRAMRIAEHFETTEELQGKSLRATLRIVFPPKVKPVAEQIKGRIEKFAVWIGSTTDDLKDDYDCRNVLVILDKFAAELATCKKDVAAQRDELNKPKPTKVNPELEKKAKAILSKQEAKEMEQAISP